MIYSFFQVHQRLSCTMPSKLTHSQCCDSVCLICGNEAGRGDRKITQAEIYLIREHVMPGYDPRDER